MTIKGAIISACAAVVLLCSASDSFSNASAEIKSVMKVNRMGSYIMLINYQTHDEWTDGLIFKACCKFNEGEIAFTSASLNNIPRGWHKTEVAIPEVIKKRYGSLREYRIELYCKGILLGIKTGY
ncbi:MAG: hypothetical protein Q8O12_01060 [Candidatus Omnitrophota bacterium]|nr:hypothetical protein [Candidatus Omnitrophota bacterium]